MALVPHVTDKNRKEILTKIESLKKEGGAESADKLLEEHNIKVGENDTVIAVPPKLSTKTAGK